MKSLRWLHRALFAFAFLAFAYCAYVLTESWIFQREETRNLERLVLARQTTITDTSPQSASPAKIAPGGLIGRIEVKRLGMSAIVVEGTEIPTLKRAAGHIPGTALPGEPGNVGIAAHRDT